MDSAQTFWEQGPPMAFIGENMPYHHKRQFRYSLQNYMHDVFHFDEFAGKRVLDLGCGSGIDSVEFARNGAIVTCGDFTDTALKATEALFEEVGMDANIYKVDATNMWFRDEVFDCVYCFGVLHHIPEVEKAISEIRRVLKPGGQIMAMVYHRDSLLYGYSIMYRRGMAERQLEIRSENQLLSRYSERRTDNPYTQAYSKQEALELFGKYFSDCSAEVRYNVIDLPEERKVKVHVDDKYELGWHLIIKGVKGD